ncbi:MAG TPA: DEAD/DEAH box helicase [Chloroflexia bacterium]|nr:DEAD/DEAH box helicase [Chloroflexia bacterium]
MASTFKELGLSDATLKAITELGYEEPTPIQERTIEVLLEGKDVIAQAQTGTGKTAAFALPIIEKLDLSLKSPQALIMTPTRELAVQVAEAFHSYSKYQPISTLPVYGGQPIEMQLRAFNRGVHVVVGTPGRVLDHLRRGTLKLENIRTVVLDEADEMLAMGFIEDIEAVLKQTPENRQTALFSATMPKPISDLAKNYMHDPQRITVKAEQMTVPQIRQVYYEVGKRDKFEVLVRVLDYERPTAAIIFCRTKLEVDSLGERLTARAYPTETLHGDLNQTQRDRVMARFRNEQVELLVATDVAARGLDIEHITHVINYDIPIDPEIYVHRIGRTGRAGRSGCAITLVTPRERRLWQMIQRETGSSAQRLQLPTIADVFERRREEFKETIRETLAQNGLEPYRIMAEEMGEEFSPTDISAAAFKLLLGEQPAETQDLLAEPEVVEETRERTPQPRRREREQRTLGPEQGMTRLYLAVGRDDGVRPGDIVGAIANEANIAGRSIGAIELYDRFSLVDVPSNEVQNVLQALQNTRIRSQKASPSLARPVKNKAQTSGRKEPARREAPARDNDSAGASEKKPRKRETAKTGATEKKPRKKQVS